LSLIGELHRQAGNRKQALVWLTRAKVRARGRLAALVEQQLFLARHEGKPPKGLLEAARQGSAGAKVAAVKFLRDIDDKEVIAFLKDVCLSCPDELREKAMDALVDKGPKRYHLPIFLAGLRNKHFRTVQGSAWAVEQLRAPEAAPIIVQALKDPVEFAEHRLREALAATATEKELEFLLKQPEQQFSRSMVFKGLLSTRSPKVVPHIIRMLQKEPGLTATIEYKTLKLAAAFGPSLLDKLPDLKTATGNDELAVFKAKALGVSRSPQAEKQLVSALPRGGQLALEAALALALRGNDAGRNILLKHLDRIHIHSILRPADFEAVQHQMTKEKTERKSNIQILVAMHNRTLEDPEADESRKRSARRQLRRLKWDEDSFMSRWVLMLGATGNPGARPICLKCLESSSPHLRAEAAKALAYLYDDSVGDALAGRLESEDSEVKRAIIRAMGKARDKRHVEALTSLAGEPTLVKTKLAWIETMMALAPEKARPFLQKWLRSPNDELAAAAKKALSTLEKKQGNQKG